MRQLFPIFQMTAPKGATQVLPLYWDVDMDHDKGVPRFSDREPALMSGLEAVKGWTWRMLHTERYYWSPFSWDHGCKLESLVGQPYRADIRLNEAVRYVREALTVCPYITKTTAEVVNFDDSILRVRVSLTTVYGEASIHVWGQDTGGRQNGDPSDHPVEPGAERHDGRLYRRHGRAGG